MRIWLILLIVAAAVGVAAGAMVVLQRYAKWGFFRDPLHATAALQVSGTIFAVMVGFVLLLAFQSYGNARTSSQEEASATEALFETAAHFPAPAGRRLQGGVICYARSVVHEEWPSMADDAAPNAETSRWVERIGSGAATLDRGAIDTAAGQNWFARSAAQEGAREARLGEAEPLVPTTVWILLLIGGLAVLGFVLLFASSRERRWPQAAMVAVVTTLVASSLLIVAFLDNTYGDHGGSVQPRAMRASLETMEREWRRDAPATALPCDSSGRPRM